MTAKKKNQFIAQIRYSLPVSDLSNEVFIDDIPIAINSDKQSQTIKDEITKIFLANYCADATIYSINII